MGWSYTEPPGLPAAKREAWVIYGSDCYICQRPAHEIDHVINIKAGGTHDIQNLRPICKDCHKRKTAAEAGAGKSAAWRRKAFRPTEDHPGARNP